MPRTTFQQGWQTLGQYFNQLHGFKDHAQMPIFQVDLGSYVGILQAENSSVLNSQLTSLQTLQKEHLLKVNEQNFSVQLKLGYAFSTNP